MLLSVRLTISAVIASAILGGCQARVETHGFMPNRHAVGQIEPGVQSKNQVTELLGTPSTVATFDEDTWYYVTQRTENYAFFRPEIIEQQVMVVEFDEAGVVENIHRYTLEDGKVVELVSRKTPTAGKELTLLEQLFGNIGRFSE